MRKRNIAVLSLIFFGLVVFAPTAAAHCHNGFNGCSNGYSSNNYDRGYHQSDRGNYQRGGLAHDYFHTDQFFGREIQGFPDTAFGENSRYDMREKDRYNKRHRGSYDQRYDSGPYGAFSGLALRYGEGFVGGEGFGDEYVGDPDQLDEEIYLFN